MTGKTNYERWQPVEIIWHDSHMIHGWTALDQADIDLEYSLEHRSIGYYLGETGRQITICQSSKTEKDFIKEPDTQVCGVFTVPKRAIVRIKKL